MEENKVKFVIDLINNMDIKDKIRLAIRMSESNYTNIKYDKDEMFKKFDNMLKEIDGEYKTKNINFNKFFAVNFAMVKIMEMTKENVNQVALYLINNIYF